MQKIRTLLFSFSRLPNPQIHACSFVKRKEQSKEFASWEQEQKKERERERERSEKNVFSKGTTRSLKEKRKENEKKMRRNIEQQRSQKNKEQKECKVPFSRSND